MCKSISIKQIPDITEEEAVALARKPTIFSMNKNGSSKDDHSFSKCAIPGCGDKVNLMTYASHFSLKHKELPLNNILVTANDGIRLTCIEWQIVQICHSMQTLFSYLCRWA